MALTRRIFISSPRNEYLDEARNALKWAIVQEIEALGYEAQIFGAPEGSRGLARGGWSAEKARDVMQRCCGAAILGFPIWKASPLLGGPDISLVTEYCHYEGALARAYGLPILAVLEQNVEQRVFFNRYAGDSVIRPPVGATAAWSKDTGFQNFLHTWQSQVAERRDVFLAYSSALAPTAEEVGRILIRLGATVLDWKTFAGGPSILEQVQRAADRTTGGVFLFTRDDLGATGQAVPRDNVIYEAGFFAALKGHERCLIIREEGAKMPADVGGLIFEPLADRSNPAVLEPRLQLFVREGL